MSFRAVVGGGSSSTGQGATYNVKTYGAVADGLYLTDVSTTAGGNGVSSPSYAFVNLPISQGGDIGKYFNVQGAGATTPDATNSYNGLIGSVTGTGLGNTANLVDGGGTAVNATTTIAGTGDAFMGRNNSSAFQAAIDAAFANPEGGAVYVPSGNYQMSIGLNPRSRVSWYGDGDATNIEFFNVSGLNAGLFQALNGSAGNAMERATFRDCRFSLIRARCAASTYNVSSKCFYIQYMRDCTFKDMTIVGSPASAIGTDFGTKILITGNRLISCGRWNNGTTDLGGAAIGIGTANNFTEGESYIVTNNHILAPKRFGIFFETQIAGGAQSTARIVCADNLINLTATSKIGIADSGSRNFECSGNVIVGVAGGGNTGIAVNSGTLASIQPGLFGKIIGNMIKSVDTGIRLDYSLAASATGPNYEITNNTCQVCGLYGIRVDGNLTVQLDTIKIHGNHLYTSGFSGILLDAGATGTPAGMKNVSITNNFIYNSGQAAGTFKSGITVRTPTVDLHIARNEIYDNQTGKTQDYAIRFVNGATNYAASGNASIVDNDMRTNLTGTILLDAGTSFVGVCRGNIGDNPTTEVTAAYTMVGLKTTVIADTTGSSFAVTLPSPAAFVGEVINVKKKVAGNTLTLTGTVDGVANPAFTAVANMQLISNATEWKVI